MEYDYLKVVQGSKQYSLQKLRSLLYNNKEDMFMEYQVIEKNDYYVVRMFGKFNRNAIYSIRQTLKPLFTKPRPRIAVDMGELTAGEAELIYQLGLLNAIRRGVDLAGGILKVCSLKPSMKHYLLQNRLNGWFDLYEDLESAEQNFSIT